MPASPVRGALVLGVVGVGVEEPCGVGAAEQVPADGPRPAIVVAREGSEGAELVERVHREGVAAGDAARQAARVHPAPGLRDYAPARPRCARPEAPGEQTPHVVVPAQLRVHPGREHRAVGQQHLVEGVGLAPLEEPHAAVRGVQVLRVARADVGHVLEPPVGGRGVGLLPATVVRRRHAGVVEGQVVEVGDALVVAQGEDGLAHPVGRRCQVLPEVAGLRVEPEELRGEQAGVGFVPEGAAGAVADGVLVEAEAVVAVEVALAHADEVVSPLVGLVDADEGGADDGGDAVDRLVLAAVGLVRRADVGGQAEAAEGVVVLRVVPPDEREVLALAADAEDEGVVVAGDLRPVTQDVGARVPRHLLDALERKLPRTRRATRHAGEQRPEHHPPPDCPDHHWPPLESGRTDDAHPILARPVAATQEENSGWAHKRTKPTPLVLFASSRAPQRHHLPAKSKPYGIDRKAARSHKVCPVRVFLGARCAHVALEDSSRIPRMRRRDRPRRRTGVSGPRFDNGACPH